MALSAPWRTALGLAKYKGLPVLPCMPDKKLPLTKHGCYSASTDEKKIRKWAEHYPDALIAVPTGAVSGLVAIDVDPGGAQWYAENSAELACGRIHTTRRGWHLLYRQPQGVIVPSVRDVPVPGVDVRGTGGYIIWWPAHLGVSKDTVTGELDDVTNLPPWLEQQIAKPAHSTRGSGGAGGLAGAGRESASFPLTPSRGRPPTRPGRSIMLHKLNFLPALNSCSRAWIQAATVICGLRSAWACITKRAHTRRAEYCGIAGHAASCYRNRADRGTTIPSNSVDNGDRSSSTTRRR